MNLSDFAKQLSEFYDEMKSIADEAVGGFAIDSLHPSVDKIRKRKAEIVRQLSEEESYKRVMIDFDKTIHPYKKGWNDGKLEDAPYPEAKGSIEKLKNAGYEIVIFSTRVSQGATDEFKTETEDELQNISNYLKNYGIYFDRITGDKIAADFYIDDKAVYIKNGNWKDVLSQIKTREKSLK